MTNLNIDEEKLIKEIIETTDYSKPEANYSDVAIELKEWPKYTDPQKQREQ